MKYFFPAIAVVALVLSVVALVPKESKLGGQYTTNYQEFNGVTNNGTLTQTGASTFTGAATFASTITSAGNLSAVKTTTTTLSLGNTGVGKLCLWNGTQFSVLSFPAGSTSTAIATSTLCQ